MLKLVTLWFVDASRPRDPHGCPMDACFQPRMVPASTNPTKDVRTGCPDTPSDGFVSHCLGDQSTTLFSESDSLPSSLREGSFIVSKVLPPFNGGTTFWFVMMALRWWQNHHHSASDYQKSWEMTCHHSCPFALQAAECGLWQAVWGDSVWPASYGHGPDNISGQGRATFG